MQHVLADSNHHMAMKGLLGCWHGVHLADGFKEEEDGKARYSGVSGWGGGLETLAAVERREEVEVEREGWYSVYCKRARREAMEDRYSAVVNLKGDWFERSQ
ncbi:hypothetical protein Vadar_002599 [Vaccinium darrowii]|uniref:Uncharacterized protein n=1 Tax=Vaccinium darrowii TaxID=229202 RepID=A0ACB7ZJ36_9ERIC|nr:hypothetical protein Vadar_002599 [Vaccinium darrowii]